MVVKFINEDRYGNLWAGTLRHGLARIDGQNGQVSRYVKDQSDQFNLQSNNMMAFCEDSSGLLWLGTNGGGFFNFEIPKKLCSIIDIQLWIPIVCTLIRLADDALYEAKEIRTEQNNVRIYIVNLI